MNEVNLIGRHGCEARFFIFFEACPSGMGFTIERNKIGFVSSAPRSDNPELIFYFVSYP